MGEIAGTHNTFKRYAENIYPYIYLIVQCYSIEKWIRDARGGLVEKEETNTKEIILYYIKQSYTRENNKVCH